MTSENPQNLDEHLERAWMGEIYGEAIFRAAAEADPANASKWLALARVEQHTGKALAPHVAGSADTNTEAWHERGLALGKNLAEMPWLEAMGSFEAATKPAIDRFYEMREMASEDTAPAVELLIDHEVALQEFADYEIAGDPDSAMASIDGFFNKWATSD